MRPRVDRDNGSRGHTPGCKKRFGQHFLRKQSVVDHMIGRVGITPDTTVMEIGCGDGFLTRSILDHSLCKRLLCLEIDPEWRDVVAAAITDPRLDLQLADVLALDWLTLPVPLTLLSNLPYQITFPLLFLMVQHKHLFTEGVVMIQEEVAQKLVAMSGRSYTHVSLFLRHHFEFELMEKIGPEAFVPPPKVNSRLVYFKPRTGPAIPEEERFWKFVKHAFTSPRQTLRNNLKHAGYPITALPVETLNLRAQQLPFEGFLDLWKTLI
jgi:16S rRNA (adenine1518-N6/adenine1519-N6)-dimethyltransferase